MAKRGNGSLDALLKGAGTFVLGLGGGWLAYSRLLVDHNVPLPKAIDADRRTTTSPAAGRMSYYVDDRAEGTPLVLIHSINAAPSALEMKPLFEYYRGKRPVYALELPGFGFSSRLDREYSPEFFADAISDFLATVIGEPADVVVLSLTSEFAARSAVEHPEHYRTLTLLSPTGFSLDARPGGENVHEIVSFPLWNQPLYDLLVTRPSMRFFLAVSFKDGIPPGYLDYAYATAHQPGARYAPFYFVAGELWTEDVMNRFYARLTMPVLVIYGSDPNVRFDELPEFVSAHDNWWMRRLEQGVRLPQWDRLEKTAAALEKLWAEVPAAPEA